MSETGTAAAPPKPEIGEISASGDGRDITKPFIGPLEINQDSVLAARGGGLEVYEQVLRDDQVHSCLQQRFGRVCALDWQVDAGAPDKQSQMAADFMREMVLAPSLQFDAKSRMMLFALFYGYGVAECLFAQDGKNVFLDQLKVRRARRFRFDTQGGLRLLTRENMIPGELMPERKFWTWSVGADNDDAPYGLGLGHWCYWPVYLKRNGLKFWSIFLDKYGSPTAVGSFPPGTSLQDQGKLLQAARAIQTDSALVKPDGMLLELLQAARAAGGDYDLFYDRMDKAIAKVIASQTMTTEDGSSRAQGQVHEDVAELVAKTDADLQCASFNNGPVKWLTDWNYPDAVPPRVYRCAVEEDDLETHAERDTKIYAMGFEPSENYVRETYGGDWTRRATPPPDTLPSGMTLPNAETGQQLPFAEAGFTPDAIDKRVKAVMGEWKDITGPIGDQLYAEAQRAAKAADPYAAFRKALAGMRDKLNITAFARRIALDNFQAFGGAATGDELGGDKSKDADADK